MRNRNGLPASFWMLWGGSTATNLGDGIRLVALPLLAVQLTGDPAQIALVTVFTYLPALLFGPIAGVLVDRANKRNLIAWAHVARSVVLAVVAVSIWTDTMTIGLLCLAALGYGIGESVADPAAHAFLPLLVPRASLGAANSRLQSGQIVGEMFVGRAAGGILFMVGQPLPIVVNVGLLAAASLITLRIRKGDADVGASPAPGRTNFWSELAAGVVAVGRSGLLVRMSIVLAIWAGASGAFWGVAAVHALSELNSGPSGFGIMLAVSAIGSLAGATLAIPVVRTFGAATTTLLAIALSGGSILALAWTDNVLVASALLAVNGFAVVNWNVISTTIRQTIVPQEILGKVSSTYRVLATATMPLGAGLAGIGAASFGTPTVFLVSGAAILATGLLLLPGLWPALARLWPPGASSAIEREPSSTGQ